MRLMIVSSDLSRTPIALRAFGVRMRCAWPRPTRSSARRCGAARLRGTSWRREDLATCFDVSASDWTVVRTHGTSLLSWRKLRNDGTTSCSSKLESANFIDRHSDPPRAERNLGAEYGTLRSLIAPLFGMTTKIVFSSLGWVESVLSTHRVTRQQSTGDRG